MSRRARHPFVSVELFGADDVSRRFAALPWVMQDRILPLSLRRGAEIVRERVKALAPRRRGVLASSAWSLRRSTKRVGGRPVFVGVKVATPKRAALGIPETATGFYPYSLEFGWRVGARVVGPVDVGARVVKRNKRGKLYRANERTVKQARKAMQANRRKIPGRRYMYAALFGAQSLVVSTIRNDVAMRVRMLTPGAIDSARAREVA